jgi:hypothetical protein
LLLRRGPRLTQSLSYSPLPSQRDAESSPRPIRSSSPVYSGGATSVYPQGVTKSKERIALVLEVLGDGKYHPVSEVRDRFDDDVDCVVAVGDLLDAGYVVVRSGDHLRVRRRGPLERRQSLAVLFDGLQLGSGGDDRALQEGEETVQEEVGQRDDGGGFDVGADAGVVLSDPAGGLSLAVDGAASMTGAILARKGSGKSYLGGVLVEELMLKVSGVALVVFDPTGGWWGLLSTASGEASDHGVVLLGGPRGHEEIMSDSGARVAEVVEALCPRPVVVDMSELAPSEQHELVADFCERLLGLPQFPVHVVLDEADEFCPQRLSGAVSKHQKRALGFVERMVMRGRHRGIGVTLISLRPAVVSKNVLSQVDSLWLLQMVEPNDIRAVEDWLSNFEHKVTERQRVECLSQLPMMPVGMAYFLRGGEHAMFRRFKVRHKLTYDSSKTLVVGARDNPILSTLPPAVRAQLREILSRSKLPEVSGGS